LPLIKSPQLLLVNGIGMTTLTPITKFMVHLPLAFHQGPSESALIICFAWERPIVRP